MFEEVISQWNLSVGMAVTTYGIIIYTIFNNIAFRRYDRFRNDYNILFDEILDTERWVRWPFLKRKEIFKFQTGDTLKLTLENPPLEFIIGKVKIKIDVPTTYEDMFDLSIRNYFELKKHKTQFMQQEFAKKNKKSVHYLVMRYLCLYDMWKSIYYFKVSRSFVYVSILLVALGAIIIINPIRLLFTLI